MSVFDWRLLLGLFALAQGCGAPKSSPLNYSVRQAPTGDKASILEAAEAALVGQGYQIARRDSGKGVIETLPIEVPRTEDDRRHLSSRGRTRRLAEVRVEEAGPVRNVYCKVILQGQATREQDFFAREQRGQDTPADTPIDRDAATTEEQNTVWRTMRRDREAERALLEAILRSGPGAPGTP